MASIDDLFRTKTLQDIHGVLRQTRSEIEAKKQELRQLVGDHYRSVLESSDHIRAMSDCAAKISSGADHIEELITSMRQLAASPPATSGVGIVSQAATKEADMDHEYRVGMRVIELLEVPETVGAHLTAHHFVRAARAALLDAVALQTEVDELLRDEQATEQGVASGFDFAALARQQVATFRTLPRQISASCEDAFGVATLEPGNAAEGFAVRLLLDTSAQPLQLLRVFLDRRRELLQSLLDGGSMGSDDGGNVGGARLAAAAMAFEGTVMLGSRLCHGTTAGGQSLVEAALSAVLDGAPERDAAEERAAIEGHAYVDPSGTGVGTLRRRAESLSAALRRGSPGAGKLAVELGELGTTLAREWAPDAGGSSTKSNSGTAGAHARSLSTRFRMLLNPGAAANPAAAGAAADSAGSTVRLCSALGETLALCKEKIICHRSVLAMGSVENWSTIWTAACEQFCPGRSPLDDALSMVTATIEVACAEVARERIGDLQLELVAAADDESDALEAAPTASTETGSSDHPGAGSDARRREEVAEMQRQSRLRVLRFDEQLGEVLADLAHVTHGGEVPVSVSAACLSALSERLRAACDAVRLPSVAALWPASASQDASTGRSRALWPMQRGAARVAIALDAVLSSAVDGRDGEEVGPVHLRATLQTASSSGDPALVAQAQAIVEDLQQRSDAAYKAWARLAVTPSEGFSTLDSFWRLADDEVPHSCGWGNAKFNAKAGSAGTEEASRAIPVPVQASSFVFERLTLGARNALEVSGGLRPMSRALVTALKTALSESFMTAYEAQSVDFERLKRSGMSNLLQWLFDLRFLRVALSMGPAAGAASGNSSGSGDTAYDALCTLLDRTESTTLSDPVDRLLYQDVLKASVKSHIEGVKILLAPFFLHNPLFGFLFPAQGAASDAGAGEGDGFELNVTFAPPLRPMLPRFPRLPTSDSGFATASSLAHGSSDLDARLGLSADSDKRAGARILPDTASGVASSLMQQVGLSSFGFGKAWSALGGSSGGGKAPEAV